MTPLAWAEDSPLSPDTGTRHTQKTAQYTHIMFHIYHRDVIGCFSILCAPIKNQTNNTWDFSAGVINLLDKHSFVLFQVGKLVYPKRKACLQGGVQKRSMNQTREFGAPFTAQMLTSPNSKPLGSLLLMLFVSIASISAYSAYNFALGYTLKAHPIQLSFNCALLSIYRVLIEVMLFAALGVMHSRDLSNPLSCILSPVFPNFVHKAVNWMSHHLKHDGLAGTI